MVSLVEIQAAYYMMAATGVLVAAIYYILNLRTTLQTRQAQLFMPIYATYSSTEFLKAWSEIMNYQYEDYDDFLSKYGFDVNPDASVKGRMVNAYLEGIGVLMKRGLIEPSFVDDLMSGVIIGYWEKFEPYLLEYRKRRDWPQTGEHVEYLYNKIKPITIKQRTELLRDTT
jgi:hypothetical protein